MPSGVENLGDFKDTLRDALAAEKPALIEVIAAGTAGRYRQRHRMVDVRTTPKNSFLILAAGVPARVLFL